MGFRHATFRCLFSNFDILGKASNPEIRSPSSSPFVQCTPLVPFKPRSRQVDTLIHSPEISSCPNAPCMPIYRGGARGVNGAAYIHGASGMVMWMGPWPQFRTVMLIPKRVLHDACHPRNRLFRKGNGRHGWFPSAKKRNNKPMPSRVQILVHLAL